MAKWKHFILIWSDNLKFNISVPFSFFLFFGFYFSNFQSNQNEPSDNISNCPSRQVMRMNDLISLQVVFLS